jgi:hypothetical protein
MMSAAILVPAGADQVGVRSASPDLSSGQVEADGVSFAKSFSERVGEAAAPEEKASAGEVATSLPSAKGTGVEEKPAPVASMPGDLKKSMIPGRQISEQGKLKKPDAEEPVQPKPQTTVPAGGQEKISGGDSLPKKLAAPAQDEKTADEVPVTLPTADALPPTPNALVVMGKADNVPARLIGIPDEERPAVINTGTAAVRNVADAGKTKEVETAAKNTATKTSKTQESIAPNGERALAARATGIENVAKPVAESSTTSASPMVEQTVTSSAASISGLGRTTVEMSGTVSEVSKISTGISAAAADGSVGKGSVRGAKAAVVDTQTPVTAAAEEQGETEKPSADPEKMLSAAVPEVRNSESKMQNAVEPAAVIVHGMSGSAEASSSIVTVAPGHVAGDATVIKPVSDVGVSPANVPVETREHDESGAGAASTDGMPRMITATPTTLEVGIPNGTHGWLKVRAEMADGGINASVSAATSAGQEMLHRELPSLTAYLQQEKVAVNTVVIHTTATENSESRGSGAGLNGGGGQTPQKNNEGGEQLQRPGQVAANRTDGTISYPEIGEDGLSPLPIHAGGGSWLSVRA